MDIDQESSKPELSNLENSNVIKMWLLDTQETIGKHKLHRMSERPGTRDDALGDLRDTLRGHYVNPQITAKRIAELGAPSTAQIFKEHVPKTKTARSGDLGEILGTEIAEQVLKFKVPIRRLRWKDGREMALRGDDFIGVSRNSQGTLVLLKGESKSRNKLTTKVLEEAGVALNRDGGRPTRHSVLFIAERLRDSNEDGVLAIELEKAVVDSFNTCRTEQMLMAVYGSNSAKILKQHLLNVADGQPKRHTVGLHIKKLSKFIETLYEGL